MWIKYSQITLSYRSCKMQLDFSECKPVNACSCFVAYLSPCNGILARYKLENLWKNLLLKFFALMFRASPIVSITKLTVICLTIQRLLQCTNAQCAWFILLFQSDSLENARQLCLSSVSVLYISIFYPFYNSEDVGFLLALNILRQTKNANI